jgi:serine/threonine protein phosphatase PrpC
MDYASRTDIGLSKAKTGGINEDSVSALVFDEEHREGAAQGVGIFVVADGVGAYDNSDYASYLATTVVPNELSDLLLRLATDRNGVHEDLAVDVQTEEYPDDETIQEAITSAIEVAHEQILDELGYNEGATTIVTGLYAHGSLHLGWVGDSKAAILNRSDQTVENPTRDHSIVQHYVEEGSIRPEIAPVHEESSTIVRAVGGSDSTVETRTVPIYGDDIVLISSDGLYDAYDRGKELYRKYIRAEDTSEEESVIDEILAKTVTDDDIADVVFEATTLETAAEGLISLAQKRGGSDNVSALLFTDTTQPHRNGIDDSSSRDHPAYRDEPTYDLETDETILKE